MKATVSTALVAGADETAALDDVVQTVKARCGEIFVVGVHLEARKRTKVVTGPFPGVAEDVVESLQRK